MLVSSSAPILASLPLRGRKLTDEESPFFKVFFKLLEDESHYTKKWGGGGERIAEEIKRNVGMIREGKILELCLFWGKNSLREEKTQLLLSAPSPPHGDTQ